MAVPDTSTPRRKFGTFGGVFTPNVLTILGVIMFLRFGQVTGQAGVMNALLILLAAKLITTLTAVSLSAIATNARVEAGGAYYLISRSLGVEYGGGIALVFYLAQAISVALYVMGFAEAVVAVFPQLGLTARTVGTLANAAVFATVLLGAGWAIRVQYAILGVLTLALLSFVWGAAGTFSLERLAANSAPGYADGENMLTMFALFFPAVTGIMAGANMSGDLKDPGRALPLGTFAAIGVTALVYLGLIALLGGSVPRDRLIDDSFIMFDVARWPGLVAAGVFAATLSSAIGSMLGAPRILQAFARDRVFKALGFLGTGSNSSGEPRRAIILTAIISQVAVTLGDLNAVAPIITMFFIVTYGTLNLACFYEAFSHNPSFRPRFHSGHWSLALAGALGCAVAMLLISVFWALCALLAVSTIYWGIRSIGIRARWGDVRSGVAFENARRALLRIEQEPSHPTKNWRPIMLALGGAVHRQVAEVGNWLTAGRGVLSIGQVITGEVDDRLEQGYRAEQLLRQTIRKQDLEAFPAVVIDEDLLEGVKALLQCHGIGGIRPNTMVVGWTNDPEQIEQFGSILGLAEQLRRNIVIVKRDQQIEPWHVPPGEIHVWWHGHRNGSLLLLLAHLLTQNPGFRHRPVVVIHAVADESARATAHAHLVEVTRRARVNARPMTVVSENLRDAVVDVSSRAAMVFMGFQPPEDGQELLFHQDIERLTDGLPDVLLVYAAQELELD